MQTETKLLCSFGEKNILTQATYILQQVCGTCVCATCPLLDPLCDETCAVVMLNRIMDKLQIVG